MTKIYVCEDLQTFNVYEAVQAGELRNARVYMDVYKNDPVLDGRYLYEDGGWTYVEPPPKRPIPIDPKRNSVPPECAKQCKWRQNFNFSRQKNALRSETAHMIQKHRCGWNINPKVIGGHPLDYAPCTY